MRGRGLLVVVAIGVALGLAFWGSQVPLSVQAHEEEHGGHGAPGHFMGSGPDKEQREEAEGEQPQGLVVGYDGRTPIRISADHAGVAMDPGGVPKGWKFTIPVGDPKQGRRLFVKFECYKCHKIEGERFPGKPGEVGGLGPDLTGMGVHSAEYLAESILNPNAVLLEGDGFLGGDGLSKMPSYNDVLTLQELVDLVAYLKTLVPKEGEHAHGGHHH